MTLFSMVVLILVQLPRITVTSSVTWCNICGSDMLMYSRSLEHELFYVNGVAADRVSFCGALKLYNAIGGFSSFEKEKCEGFYTSLCNLDASLDMHSDMPRIARRKSLLESKNIDSETGDMGQKGHSIVDKHKPDSSVNPRMISMAIPAFFIFCSCLLCPCFRSRRKDVAEAVLTKDSSSMDSMPSTELHHGSGFHGSPARMPGSPFRNPASHLRVPPSPSRFSLSPQLSRAGSVHLNMSQVIKATQNFSPLLKIGEGGFGDVYRAQLQDGTIVAIKRAKKELINSLQSEFSSEVELLAKIEHRNLVRLLGYVDKGNERIIITEHVPNGTLREHLDGQHGKILDFNQRLEICIDVAHALTYLHLYAEKQIIHRDVKSSNILLTESFRAKVADFGFARLGTSEGDDQTHILTKVKGTVGYLDPEYMRTYQLTPKSDVFSFGILMTEILTGRRPVESRRDIEERITIKWAFNSYNDGNVVGLLDPEMNETVDIEILKKMFSLAFQCAAPTRGDRPNMKEVGEQLWLIRMDCLKSVRKC